MYFFERILYRISISKYKYNFIIKGGLLLSSLFENESRTTQDMDTMIKGIEVSESKLNEVLTNILELDVEDNIRFEILSFKKIREEDLYGGYRASIKASIDSLTVNLKIYITTGDPIVPREIEYNYKCLIDDGIIKIMAFSKYSIIAEKFETLIETLETDTRAKDFYDIYQLMKENLDKDKLSKAIYSTFKRRNKLLLLKELPERLNIISNSKALREYWKNYQRKNEYAKDITYEDFISSINKIINVLEELKQIIWHKENTGKCSVFFFMSKLTFNSYLQSYLFYWCSQ